jgi:hypothetical protein
MWSAAISVTPLYLKEIRSSETVITYFMFVLICTVTCKVLRVAKIKGSRSDDWIYWHFGYNLS